MICTKCGKTTPGALKRCIGCGARLAEQPGAGEFLRGEFPELTERHADPTEQQAATGVLTPTPPMPTPPTPMPTLPTSVFPTVATVADTPVPTRAAPGPDPGDGDAPTILAGGDQLRVLASHSPATPSGPDETVLLPADRASRYERPTNGSASAALRTDDGPLAVGQAFGPRYHIIRMLGVGGMGAVYQAWDAELGLAVAIKVIRPEITADPQTAADVARRFKRELVLARQVTHKNVVRIHDLGEIDGIKYITMPYIEGDDLATLIKKHNDLPVPRALRITRSIVSGLVAAHTAGVVHRDLKPANIMIDAEGEALIMDFGIARSTGAPVGNRMPGEQTIVDNLRQVAKQADATVYGAVVGTVAYMAPEQARGVSVDQRADVYALGLIFYDMLVGPLPGGVGKSHPGASGADGKTTSGRQDSGSGGPRRPRCGDIPVPRARSRQALSDDGRIAESVRTARPGRQAAAEDPATYAPNDVGRHHTGSCAPRRHVLRHAVDYGAA